MDRRRPYRYDQLGRAYRTTRREGPRLASQIHAALGDARTVVNVGAGAGSYEPHDRAVIAVEPPAVMIAQRPRGAAPVVWAVAEALPFADQRFDAAMALWTIHHWSDLDQGLAELRRVARRSVVVSASTVIDHVWLTADYWPGMAKDRRPDIAPEVIAHKLGGVVRIELLLLPRDCVDGFREAYWARPEAYLTPDVRAAMSCFQLLDPAEVEEGLRRLAADLTSGAWDARHGDLRDRLGGRSSCATCAIRRPWRQFRHLCARRHAAMRKEAPMKQPITLPSSPVRADRVAHKPRVRARTQTR